MEHPLYEDLLSAWLNLSACLWNERFMSIMSFNEAFVCNLLYKRSTEAPEDPYLPVKTLLRETKLLKSQMNKILNDLEERDLIQRSRFDTDRRQVFVRLKENGRQVYETEHAHILEIVDQLVQRLGREKTETVTSLLNEISEIIESIKKP